MGFFRRHHDQAANSGPAVSDVDGQRAPDVFSALLKDRWAPVLREAGLRGSRRTFVLPDDRDWAMLGFQSSMASNADSVKFTINLLVVGKQDWDDARQRSPHLSAIPSPNTLGLHRYAQRVGQLTHGRDHWWRLYASHDPEPLVAEVTAALREVALPTLRRELLDQRPGPRGMFGGGSDSGDG